MGSAALILMMQLSVRECAGGGVGRGDCIEWKGKGRGVWGRARDGFECLNAPC